MPTVEISCVDDKLEFDDLSTDAKCGDSIQFTNNHSQDVVIEFSDANHPFMNSSLTISSDGGVRNTTVRTNPQSPLDRDQYYTAKDTNGRAYAKNGDPKIVITGVIPQDKVPNVEPVTFAKEGKKLDITFMETSVRPGGWVCFGSRVPIEIDFGNSSPFTASLLTLLPFESQTHRAKGTEGVYEYTVRVSGRQKLIIPRKRPKITVCRPATAKVKAKSKKKSVKKAVKKVAKTKKAARKKKVR